MKTHIHALSRFALLVGSMAGLATMAAGIPVHQVFQQPFTVVP